MLLNSSDEFFINQTKSDVGLSEIQFWGTLYLNPRSATGRLIGPT